MAALQPPFFGWKMNLAALRHKIEKCQYPPIPSTNYSAELSDLVDKCLQRIPTERPVIYQVAAIARRLRNRQFFVDP